MVILFQYISDTIGVYIYTDGGHELACRSVLLQRVVIAVGNKKIRRLRGEEQADAKDAILAVNGRECVAPKLIRELS